MPERQSQYCLKWCDTKGCFDSYEKRLIGGISKMVWVVHCKELDKVNNKASRFISRTITKERK